MYCGNNPVMRVDPSALAWWNWAISGALIGLGALLVATGVGSVIGVSLIVAGGSMLATNIMDAAGVDSKLASIISSGLNIVAGTALLFTPFAAIGASMIGSGIGGIAGGYISEALGFSFTTGALIGGIIGGIVGGQVYKNLTTTKLFRAVDADELSSIKSSGKFSLKQGGLESKQFGVNLKETRLYAGAKINQGQYSAIVKIRVPNNVVKQFEMMDTIDSLFFKSGVVTVSYDQISLLNKFMQYLKYVRL